MDPVLPIHSTPQQEVYIPGCCDKIKKVALYALQILASAIVEIFAVLACAVLFPFSQTWFDKKVVQIDDTNDKTIPIILVHGYLHNSSGMILQKYWLKKAGFTNVFTVNLGWWPVGKTIQHYTSVLQTRVNEIMTAAGKTEDKRVNLVGHSMGGLVSADYAMTNPDVKVLNVVTLASPLKGTKMNIFGPGKCARQMDPNHPFVNNLGIAGNNKFVHFGSRADLIVSRNSALNRYPGDNRPVDPKYNFFGGHASILFSRRINKEIIKLFA